MAKWNASFKSRYWIKLSRFTVANSSHGAIDFAQGFQVGGVFQPFGRDACSGSLQDSSGFDRVPDIVERKFARGKAGVGKRLDQALVFQSLERQAQRSAGYAELSGQRDFRDSLARTEFPAKQHFAQAQRGA